MKWLFKWLWAMVFAGVLGVGQMRGRAEEAPPSATCTVRVVNALPSGGGMDPSIARLRPYLEQPPFTAWKAFKLLSSTDVHLLPGATASLPLPSGGSASVTYTTHRLDAAGRHQV